MAPGLERRIGGAGSPPQSASSKRHHKHHKKRSKSDKADRDDAGGRDLEREAKKKKHHKKHKKHKKSSRHDKGASSGKHAAAPGESSSDSDQWVVKGEDGPTPAELQAKRDASEAAREDWMVPAALRQAEAAADPAELRSLRAADPFAALTGGEDHRRSKAAERAREKERKEREAAKEQGSARELNPYFADGGKGLPPDRDVERAKKLGGWRARALKRAGADIAVSEGDGASSSSSRSAGQDGGEPRSVSDDRGETRPAMIRPSADASGWRRRLREAVSASETGVGDEATTGAGDAPGHPGDSWAPSPAAAHVDHGAAEGAGGSPPPSDTMINDLAAAHMRAQLMGDDAEAARINIQLERAKSRKAGGGGGSHGGGRGPSSSERSRGEAPQEHVLMHTRKDGFAMPARGVAKVVSAGLRLRRAALCVRACVPSMCRPLRPLTASRPPLRCSGETAIGPDALVDRNSAWCVAPGAGVRLAGLLAVAAACSTAHPLRFHAGGNSRGWRANHILRRGFQGPKHPRDGMRGVASAVNDPARIALRTEEFRLVPGVAHAIPTAARRGSPLT